MGLGHRWREVEKMYAQVNQLFGDIVKVTPSSKVVGDMTLFLMAKEMEPADVLKLGENHDVSFPNSVVEMLSGVRSEEHTSELQSRLHLVCRLLLEKKKRSRLLCRPLAAELHRQPCPPLSSS